MYLWFLLLGMGIPNAAALPKGLASPPWSKLGIWKSCDNMWCAFGFVCVMRKSPEYEGPLCVKGGSLTCASVDCMPPARCIHVEKEDCEVPPCGPTPTCVPLKDHMDPDPRDEICSKVKCPPDSYCRVDFDGNGKCFTDTNCESSTTCQILCIEGLHPADTAYGLQCIPVSLETLPPPNEYCPLNCVVGTHCEIVPQGPRCIPDKITCGDHETKDICGNLCEGKCSTANSGRQDCPDICIAPACACDENYYRNDEGKCVSKEECGGGSYATSDSEKMKGVGKPPSDVIPPPKDQPICAAFCPVGTCVQENGKAKCVSVSEDRPYLH